MAAEPACRGFLDLAAGQITASPQNVRAREAERRRTDALAELDRAKTALSQDVSHEFRTPLSLIIGPAEDAQAEAETDAQRERLAVVTRNARRLNATLGDGGVEVVVVEVCSTSTRR